MANKNNIDEIKHDEAERDSNKVPTSSIPSVSARKHKKTKAKVLGPSELNTTLRCPITVKDAIHNNHRPFSFIGHTVPRDLTPQESNDSNESSCSIKSYEDTIKEWRHRGATIAFIYDFILDKYRKRVDFFTLLAFLLISLTSLLALGNFGINDGDYPELTLAFKAVNAVLATSATISAGIVRVRGWTYLVENCQKYLDTVEHFVASIISEQTLPMRIRINPEQFILQQKDKFQAILNSAPDISHDDYLQAIEYYEKSKTRFRHDLVNV